MRRAARPQQIFVRIGDLLGRVIQFGATAEGRPVLGALRTLPGLMGRERVTPDEIDISLPAGSWRRLLLRAARGSRAGVLEGLRFQGFPVRDEDVGRALG
ncbi:MAG TPA: hypothetical protein VM347_22615 [Nonomuraea sp.]|nr:hypothetical protein [Nonomuraea sp.]